MGSGRGNPAAAAVELGAGSGRVSVARIGEELVTLPGMTSSTARDVAGPMMKFNVHGWEHLSGNHSEIVEIRKDVLQQLGEVQEPHRSVWEKRLKSKLDHSHFSVRLEIFLHHFFNKRGWQISIEPELPGTPNSPDFLLSKAEHGMIVEARTVLGAKSEMQQDSRLMQLADGLSRKLSRTVLIHPMIDLPSSLPSRRIAAEIENRSSRFELLQEFYIEGEHQGQPYSLEVTVILEDKPGSTADVGVTAGQAVHVEIGHPVREAILKKAKKDYGEIDAPFVIATWPKLPWHFSDSDDDDLVALYGDEVWVGPSYSDLRVSHMPNGVFTLQREDDSRRYSHVSAVVFYHPDKSDFLKVYHNPFARRPVRTDAFKGIPQCYIDLATGKAQWLRQ